jgi:MFS family permease
MGMLSDRVSLRKTILLSAFGGALSCFFLFGFATSLPTLIIFAITWGLTGLGYTSIITRTVTYVAKDDPHTPMVIFSIFVFSQGVAMICSGPVASALLQSTVSGLRFGYGVDSYVSTRFSTLYNQVRREKTDALMAT